MVSYVITGTNKPNGIGQGLVKELAQDSNNKVFATVRDPSKAPELTAFAKEHSNVFIIQLADITSEDATEKAVKEVESKLGLDEGLDVLISNAAIVDSYAKVVDTKAQVYLDHWRVNTLGNIITFQKFYPLLKKSQTRKVFFTSSAAGSITDHLGFVHNSPYGSSKAALNHLVRDLNSELKDEGFKFLAYHPGFVATDLGVDGVNNLLGGDIELARKTYGLIDPQESVKNIKKNLIDGLNEGKIDTDHMWNGDGTVASW